jgi:micrococcal nuclease
MANKRQTRGPLIPLNRTGIAIVVAVTLVAVAGWRTGFISFQTPGSNDRPTTVLEPAQDRTIPRPWLYMDAPDSLLEGYLPIRRVIDGDTIIVMQDGEEVRVRLIGIDCPEIGRERVDPLGPGWQATLFVVSVLEDNAQVRLEQDRERLDRFGRTLAYVYLPDGRMLNEILMQEGWATTMRIPPNTRHAATFANHEREARSRGLGMWAQ